MPIESNKDLIPYYPHIICVGAYDNEKKKATIRISEESWAVHEEREMLGWYLRDILKIYNRCKRKKIGFTVDLVMQEMRPSEYIQNIVYVLANRVLKDGKKATIDGLHTPMGNIYRQELIKEMIKNGLNPEDYGYNSYVEKERKE